MAIEDIELMDRLEKHANRYFDGHVTIMKFTTNWRVGFGTPMETYGWKGGDVEMAAGKTFREAALAALDNPQRVDCITANRALLEDEAENPFDLP